MYLNAAVDLRKTVDETAKRVPAGGRIGNPEDVANIVSFRASEASRWISGNVLTANGGFLMM
jgi:3-oxoacyl-[acyl-carrier protein] reductase